MFADIPTEVVIMIAKLCDVPSCSKLSRVNRGLYVVLHKTLLQRGTHLRNPSVLGWFVQKRRQGHDVRAFINDIASHGLDLSQLEDRNLESTDYGGIETTEPASGQGLAIIDLRAVRELPALAKNPSVFGVVIRYFEHEQAVLDFLATNQHYDLELNRPEEDDTGTRDPLLVAVSRGFGRVISLLPMPPQNANSSAWNIPSHRLVQGAIEQGHRDVLKALIDCGVSLDLPEKETHALHAAAICGQQGIVKFLLDEGYGVNLLDRNGHTPLSKLLESTCCPVRRGRIARYLLKLGANTEIEGLSDERRPLSAAIAGGLFFTAVKLLECGAIITEAVKVNIKKALVQNGGGLLTQQDGGPMEARHGKELLDAFIARGILAEEISTYLSDLGLKTN